LLLSHPACAGADGNRQPPRDAQGEGAGLEAGNMRAFASAIATHRGARARRQPIVATARIAPERLGEAALATIR
jgi:hypothetical protein